MAGITTMKKQLNQTAMFPEPEPAQPVTPKVGDTHWSWTGEKWIPCTVTTIHPSGKSFRAWSLEHGYGSYGWKPNREFCPQPTDKK